MSNSSYAEGRLVRASGIFKDSAGVLVDPTVVKFSFQAPNLTPVTYTFGVDGQVVKDSTGNYHVDLDTTGKPGLWTYRWWSTGSGQTATTNDFFRVIAARPPAP